MDNNVWGFLFSLLVSWFALATYFYGKHVGKKEIRQYLVSSLDQIPPSKGQCSFDFQGKMTIKDKKLQDLIIYSSSVTKNQ